MSDDDLIRRGDAMAAYEAAADSYNNGSDGRWFRHHLADAIAALPAVTVPDLSDPVVVHLNMLRGSIAKPTIEQIVHLYGSEAFQPMIDIEKAFMAAVWDALKADATDLRKQHRILKAFRDAIAALPTATQPAPDAAALLTEKPHDRA